MPPLITWFHVHGRVDTEIAEDFASRAFGDSFVRGLQTGGEFYAVIRITSVSVSHQTSLAATLQAEANGLVASGSFKAAFEEANKSASTRSVYTATMFQKAGSGALISPQGRDRRGDQPVQAVPGHRLRQFGGIRGRGRHLRHCACR
ncbi:hypothetical protein [Nonomuraea sediminis]|uniref:hypothetical protein n=1 Tax=Nonomuraea sediminis TaxID=2835864 RepID=UPI001BDD4C13|nr:hypothetical protein [Nonomuraea sediminis]